MRLSINQRIVAGFVVLIISFGVIGFIILDNLEKSRKLTEHNAMVNQPSLLYLNKLNLVITNSRNYSYTWLSLDISSHSDKQGLKTIHTETYPDTKERITELYDGWNQSDRDSMDVLFEDLEMILQLQTIMMQKLNNIDAYQDFLLRVEMEGLFEKISEGTDFLLVRLGNLLDRITEKVTKEEEEMLASFSSIRTANITLSGIAVIIGLIVMWVTLRAVKLQAQKEAAVTERDMVKEQHAIIEEKNREILASITYAQRIQNSILPPDENFQKAFSDHFVFYCPRDIVSGDFYWMHTFENGELLVAAADSTGHGVPGAFVSLVCYNSLNTSIKEFGITKPSTILDKAAELVQESFVKQGANVRDGMDISLCKIAPTHLEFAGANNSGYLVSNGEWTELKACRQPVGAYESRKPFECMKEPVKPGDRIYLFSDGFIDQFGGPKGKKYKKPKFLELLKELQPLPMNEQLNRLEKELTDWRGDLAQIDDVLVIGITI